MHAQHPSALITPQLFSAMPERFRRAGEKTAWADANRGGAPVDCILEGPAFDRAGNLYVVDIPFGRIFRIAPSGEWTLAVEYDGWPNGLKIARDGSILIADYRRGLMRLDASAGRIAPVLTHRNSESFKGLNDLTIGANGDVLITDQGQTGPDGLAMDDAGNLAIAHSGSGSVWLVNPEGEAIVQVKGPAGAFITNIAYGFDSDGKADDILYMTESHHGAVLRATMPHRGRRMVAQL